MNRGQRASTPSNTSNNGPPARAYPPSAPRSPIKPFHQGKGSQELGLNLRRVIGTTCQGVTCFDCLTSARSFAYTAGAAAVVATIDDRQRISQRFYRANPVQSTSASRGLFSNGLGRDSPDSRYKSSLQTREFASVSPRGGPAERNDSPVGKSGSVKERVRAATTLSFSPNGRFLAVGETGWKPRVLVFSLDDKAPQDVPVAVIPEHTYGVQAVAFSSDSKYLASLGTANDGFLYVWSIDEKTGATTLIASNKCTNAVKQMCWIGQSLVTVGLRFVKIWRPNELPLGCNGTPEHKFGRGLRPLAGRNALLGDLLEATFTSVVPTSEDKAVVCTDGGDICILDDSEKNQRLTRVANVAFSIVSACLASTSQILVTGLDGSIKMFDVSDLQNTFLLSTIPPGSFTPGKSSPNRTNQYFVAIGAVAETVITVDNHHGIQLRRLPPSQDDVRYLEETIRDVPAHSDAVLGVRALTVPNKDGTAFLTWSAGGTVIFWSSNCEMKAMVQVPMDQSIDMYNITNELKSVTSSFSDPKTISGDRYGMIRISDTSTGLVNTSIRAHSGEITDIVICEDARHTLVASCSRDRTIQLFALSSDGLDLIQTLDEHAGSVTGLLFAKRGNQLLSCSADRTVVVREAIHRNDDAPAIFVITRTITLKNSPTSMRLSLYDDVILLSSTDRCIQLVNFQTGRIMSSFKASDTDGGDAVIMSSLVHLPSATGSPIIAGVSSSDKSVRLYSEDGVLLARDWGHTEGVTDIAVIQPSGSGSTAKIVTVAADGTVFIWDTVPGRPSSSDSDQSLQVPSSTGPGPSSAHPPLRKVISQSELARFQRSKSVDYGESEPPSPSTGTPVPFRAPATLRHKTSRLTVKSTPRLDPSPLTTYRMGANSAQGVRSRQRSPSPPPSPLRSKPSGQLGARPSTSGSAAASNADRDNGASSKGESGGFSSACASTEQLCRTLKSYRQRLEKSSARVPSEKLAELDNELELAMALVQNTLRRRRGSTVDLEKEVDQMSIASRSSSTDADGMEGQQVDEDATPRKKRVNTDTDTNDTAGSRVASSQDTSFVSADSYQSDEESPSRSEGEVSAGAERDA